MAPSVGLQPVAVLGLGKMGEAIAERLLDAGYPLSVYNRTEERAQALVARGATLFRSPADAPAHGEICITMLADDAALEEVVLGEHGLLTRPRRGTVLVDMSTVSVGVSERIAERAAAAGVEYLRAPVSGNPGVVRGGSLTIIVSGSEQAARELDPVLKAIGPKVLYVGDEDCARVAKLALQVLLGGTAELLGEALVLGESAGIDRARLLEVIGASAIASPFIGYKSEPLLRDDYSATFTTDMMLKDVELVLDLAHESDLRLPFARQLRVLLESASVNGYGDVDFMALYAQLRQDAGESLSTGARSIE
jgi:3-hydroxyisobutyrate dehydrogenase-like beta-hydroxyacid dehydrogenase